MWAAWIFRCRTCSTIERSWISAPYIGTSPRCLTTAAARIHGRPGAAITGSRAQTWKGAQAFGRTADSAAGAIGSYLAVNVGPGQSTRYISSEQQFGPGVAPGIRQQTNFWRGGGFAEYDWRDQLTHRTTGGKYLAQYVRYLDHNLGAYSFMRVDLEATQYIPLFNHTRVITLHGASSLTDTNANQRVPFYLQPTLGGPDTLRGYRFGPFYG